MERPYNRSDWWPAAALDADLSAALDGCNMEFMTKAGFDLGQQHGQRELLPVSVVLLPAGVHARARHPGGAHALFFPALQPLRQDARAAIRRRCAHRQLQWLMPGPVLCRSLPVALLL